LGGGYSVGIGDGMVYEALIEMTSGGMLYIPGLITNGTGIQVILRLLPENFEILQGWYY
jgi:hypothetical protein